jgi:serine/threonine protein kinase
MINEARIGGLLHHDNIVDVLEFDRADDQYYLAMEYVDGLTLADILRICRRRRVQLPHFAVVAIALGVCRGLHHAHRLRDHEGLPLRLVHRDLKPSNIIVNRGGTPKILDFGIAKATSNLVTTTTGASIKGTPRYMSPEQITGNNSLDPRSDLFSLGAILYELITLRPAFEADSVLTLAYRIVASDTRDLIAHGEDVFPGSGAILGSLLTRRPEDRYPDARALSEDVRELGRSYPAEADMAEVMGRLLPAAERPGVRAVKDVGELAQDDSETPDLMGFEEPLAVTFGSSAPGTGGWNRFVSHFDQLDASLDPDEDASTMSMHPPIPPVEPGGSEPVADAALAPDREGSSGVRWLPAWAVESVIPVLPAWAVESVIPLLPDWAVRPLERGRRLRTAMLLSLALATAVLAVVFVADPSLGMEMASVVSRAWGVPDVGFPFP